MRTGQTFVRSCRRGVHALGRGAVEFYNSSNLTFASSIAYYALMSLFPFILLLLTLLGRLTVGWSNQTLVDIVMHALPSHLDFVIDQIDELSRAPVGLGIAGTIFMFWAAMGFFGAVTAAVDHAWGVEHPRSFFKHKLVAAIMLLIAALLLVGTLALVSVTEMAEAQWFVGVLQEHPGLLGAQGFLVRNAATPLFVVTVGLIYYFVPNAKVRLRDVWWGAMVAGLLWRLAFAAFSWYVRDVSKFSVHGSMSAVVVFLVWIYVSSVILLYGVEVTAAYARLRKHLPQAAPAAAVREE